jgi:hypothetical protein
MAIFCIPPSPFRAYAMTFILRAKFGLIALELAPARSSIVWKEDERGTLVLKMTDLSKDGSRRLL